MLSNNFRNLMAQVDMQGLRNAQTLNLNQIFEGENVNTSLINLQDLESDELVNLEEV
jgi:hypothetical protein